MIEKSTRWQRTAVAAVAVALLGLHTSSAFALSLGRITVQSALGEILKAEIDVPSITAEEAASLKVGVASPAAFAAAGLEYNAAMTGLQVTLARRADGRTYMRLTSERPINDPFIDLILEANWSSGRIVRDYTMLFDPPSLKQAVPAPTLAQTPSQSVPARVSPVAPAPAAPTADPAQTELPSRSVQPKITSKAPGADGQQVVVKPGDFASRIAARNKASDVSLDQMMVAMLRANPEAFASGNLNRLRAGAVLDLPSAAEAQAIPPTEATQTVIAQSKDFNAYRRNLAGSAPRTDLDADDRKASGTVEARVEDKKSGSDTVDKLTLSKGALQAKADEERLTKERNDKEAAARAAELAKNIAELSKLSEASAKQAAAAPAPASAQAQADPALPAIPVAAAPLPVASAALPPAALVSETAAPAKPPAPPVPAVAPPEPMAEPGMMEQLLEDPMLPLAGGGLLALLGGLFLYRRRKARQNVAEADSSFLESRLQPDSFFGASGGQQVDTAQDGAPASTSEGYTNSQLGSPDDVDPVAEADVYLAYGRDKQAEDILKEALRHNPTRLAIHSKLMDIYVKRHDAASFLASANSALQLVGADSAEWARICELGLSIDPQNPFYQPGGATASTFVALEQRTAKDDSAGSLAADATMPETPLAGTDLDLDLDFSADDATPRASLKEAASDQTQRIAAQEEAASNSIDFDIPELDAGPAAKPEAAAPEMPQDLADLSLSLDDLNLDVPAPTPVEQPNVELDIPTLPEPVPQPVEAKPAKEADGMLEFDLGSLSLDLGPSAESGGEAGSASSGDNSLETKLALAEEFVSIGDHDGARALIEEVVAEASGELREKAQRALANLS